MKKKLAIKKFLINMCLLFSILIFASCSSKKNLIKTGVYAVSENDTIIELWCFYKNSNEGNIVDVVEGIGNAVNYEKIESNNESKNDEYEEYIFYIGSEDNKENILIKRDDENYIIKYQNGTEKYLKLIDNNSDKLDDYVNKYFQ